MKTLIISLFVPLLMGLLASCGVNSNKGAPIQIGINAWPGYEFLYLAKVKGFYEDEGLEVRIVEFNSLADGRDAYERGQLDGLACTAIEHLQILDNSDRSPQICIVADYSNGADVVMARPEIAAKGDLRGATIGLEIDSLGVYMLARLLDREGLQLSDMNIRPIDQMGIEDELCSGEIDLAISYPPVSINVSKDCGAVKVFSSSEIPGEIVDVIIFESDFIKMRKEDVAAVSRAFFRAQKWAEENPQQAYEIMGEREGLTGKEFGQALSDGIFIVSEDQQKSFFEKEGALDKVLENCANILRETGQLSKLDDLEKSIYRALAE